MRCICGSPSTHPPASIRPRSRSRETALAIALASRTSSGAYLGPSYDTSRTLAARCVCEEMSVRSVSRCLEQIALGRIRRISQYTAVSEYTLEAAYGIAEVSARMRDMDVDRTMLTLRRSPIPPPLSLLSTAAQENGRASASSGP